MRALYLISALCVLAGVAYARGFKDDQLKNDRVQYAFSRKELAVRRYFREKGVAYPPQELFVRVFKLEGMLEIWARADSHDRFVKIHDYPICSSSGTLGPKRHSGDGQVPEGFYRITEFNPNSQFHLSLRVSYPNNADRQHIPNGNPGGDIFIHGDCVTIGCIPLTNEGIEEVYVMAVEAQNASSNPISVHIFPTRLDENSLHRLETDYAKHPELVDFWRNLSEGYQMFEKDQRVPMVTTDEKGAYHFVR